MSFGYRIAICMFIFLGVVQQAESCTAFQLKAGDGAVLYGRTMEFGFPLDSDLLIVPRGSVFTGTAADGSPGVKWKTKLGYVGMNQSMAKNLVTDGMNEKGLVVGSLYMPGFTQYEAPNLQRTDHTLGAWELGSFLLGLCASVEDVKSLLTQVLVAEVPVPGMGNFVIPLHFYISDRTGAGLIVEYINGERRVYDNPVGVLTNSPSFDWQLNNLSNYINLSPVNVPQLELENWTIQNFSQGSGLLGLPGDYTAPSRFVRAAFFSHWAVEPKNAVEAVRLGFHILNTFDIFQGIVRPSAHEKNSFNAPSTIKRPVDSNEEITEWTIVHDQVNLKTYFRSYESLRVQMVDLKRIDFVQPGLRQIDMKRGFSVEDATGSAKPLLN